MPDYRHAMIIILVMGLMTLATRILPVLIFGRGEKIPEFINSLYKYFVRNPNEMPIEMQDIAQRYSVERAVCDYLAGMTDRYATETFKALYIPKPFIFKNTY